MLFFGTRRLVWCEVTWPRPRSPHIARSLITSGGLTWKTSHSWVFATKTGEDRRIRLCRRAITVIERQLRLRERLAREGRINHDRLFFTGSGRPISDLKYPYTRWQRTLRRLAIRYRKPYVARHTSVSWNLMVGRNPLLVAKEHGHRPTTMLSVYAAWTEGAVEADITAIREAMNCADGDGVRHKTASDQPGTKRRRRS